AYRNDPWPLHGVMESAVAAASELADAPEIMAALAQPYAAYQMEEVRRVAYIAASWKSGRCDGRTIGALASLEPHPPWAKEILQLRALCYSNAGLQKLSVQAKQELAQFEASETAATREARAEP
ncbi:MAG TPA: hypothetical protein VJZ00_17910, partial [Thermoanaerobaculia bacterium]|nr:hypothetical protein [Thermoanaerobaculia bacterium]